MGGLLAAIADHYVSGPSALVSDSFNRADSATSLGTADTGQAWTAVQGTWGIISNTGYNVNHGNGDLAVIDAAATDVAVTATAPSIANTFFGIMARYNDTTHYYLAQVDSTGHFQLYRNNAGFTQLGSTVTATWGAGDTLGLTCKGTTISLQHNGVTIISVTDATGVGSGTKTGMRDGGSPPTDPIWENFLVVAS